MSRYSLFSVSLAILVSAGCTPNSGVDYLAELWSPSFDTAANRCAAIGAPADSPDCVKRMRRFLADEKKYGKKFCYTVTDRVVCMNDPLHPDASSTLDYRATTSTGGR